MSSRIERPAPDAASLSGLNERAREIFRQIVDSYLATGEPTGSRQLSRHLPMTLSPASVRNVMQDLEELGLVYAPHTSAGRLPTELGLRFFVDAMMEVGDVSSEDRAKIEAEIKAAATGRTLENVLGEAGSLLSGLTRGAAVVLASKDNARLKQIEFVRLEAGRALAILVAENGAVENRILAIPPDLPASALAEAANYLNARIRGRTLADLRADVENSRATAARELDELGQRFYGQRSVDGHDEVAAKHGCHGGELLQRIHRHARIKVRVDCRHALGPEHQRVAVGRGSRGGFGGDDAV